jgi:hypothetical protein
MLTDDGPGQGASHQLWHLFVVAAGLWHYTSLIELYQAQLDGGACAIPSPAA